MENAFVLLIYEIMNLSKNTGKKTKCLDFFLGINNRLRGLTHAFFESRKTNPENFWHSWLFASFWVSLAIFPIGYGAREVMPLLCLVFLVPYYRYNWKNCVLARLGVVWLFYCAGIMIALGIAFSINPWASFLHAGANFSKAFILPFIAMECVRDLRDLRRLVWACVFACFWQGLDGVWQAATGADFIMGYKPHSGRLTGSLGDYSVGNYLALALVPAFAVWYVLRDRLDQISTSFIMLTIFWPALFLFQGASSRSAILAVAGVFAIWAFMRYGARSFRFVLWPGIVLGLFMIFQGMRFLPSGIVNDNRWDLWSLAWKIFLEHPWFGAGAGQYNPAFREMGLAPEREVITISHPHDLYLDILYAHGITGFCLGMIFIFGFLYWGWKNILPHIKNPARGAGQNLYWTLCAWFWLGYAAWLINGIFGHDFYRIWWLALAMCNLGIMIGAIVNGKNICQSAAAPGVAPRRD